MRSLNALACLLACVAGVPRAWAYEPGITPVVSATAEASHLIKAAPGQPLFALCDDRCDRRLFDDVQCQYRARGRSGDPGRVRRGARQQHGLDQLRRAARHLFARASSRCSARPAALSRRRARRHSSKRARNEARCCRRRAVLLLHAAPLWAQSVQYGPSRQRRRRPIRLGDRRRCRRLGRIGADPRRRQSRPEPFPASG